jgi:hypothetical protein
MNLMAGKSQRGDPRSLATPELRFNRRFATKDRNNLIPALKRRAKFNPTLRVADT